MAPENNAASSHGITVAAATSLPVPSYLQEIYWWVYVHPWALRVFEREWLVNMILLGNYARLRDAALAEIGSPRQEIRCRSPVSMAI